MKYYTHQKPPIICGEVSNLPSETRQGDTMDIKETIARFFRQGGEIPGQLGANDLSIEEREEMFDGVSEQELMDADLSEQKSFVDEINAIQQTTAKKHVSVEAPQKEEEKKSDANDSPKGE